MHEIRRVEQKLFGSFRCRICDFPFDFEDMDSRDMGLCKECYDKLEAKLIDNQGKVLE